MDLQQYLTLFESLAVNHVGIDHSGAGAGQQGFFIIEWEHFLESVTSGIQLPGDGSGQNTVMYAISYNWKYGLNPTHLLKSHEAGFSILQHVPELDDFQAIAAALAHCERITHDINMRLIYEAVVIKNPLFNGELDASSFAISPLLRRDFNYYGMVCQFDFRNFSGTCLDGNNFADLPNENLEVYNE